MEYLDKVKAAADQMMGGGQKEKVVLTYFPIASRGEVARLICAVGGLDFENNATGALPEGEVPIDMHCSTIETSIASALPAFTAAGSRACRQHCQRMAIIDTNW